MARKCTSERVMHKTVGKRPKITGEPPQEAGYDRSINYLLRKADERNQPKREALWVTISKTTQLDCLSLLLLCAPDAS